ncbi:hypothetical protein DES47_103582 [Roseateles toxinivorans]|uniref:Uncharacterized protein n=1 Tax=Roseateles toxinivorans TaxID=270368 RepID=A0A4R6QN87_9BURK|nr:hypothetical protein DES47_103582 [Roseateles toxinivorans]
MRSGGAAPRRLLPLLALALGAAMAQPQASDEGPALEELLRQGLDQPPNAFELSTASRFAQSAVQVPPGPRTPSPP